MTLASMKSLSVVLPFFNESGSVEEVLMEVKTSLPHAEIIAVTIKSRHKRGKTKKEYKVFIEYDPLIKEPNSIKSQYLFSIIKSL